jgi:branched-chain amino acid transport system ATP-binding protein
LRATRACAKSIWAGASVAELLEIEAVSAGYGPTTVLEDIAFAVSERGTLAILGRNGVGKTTLLATIMGHTRLYRGAIRVAGEDIARLPIHLRAQRGLGYVPQEREIFPSLTVEENLTTTAKAGIWTLERVFALFPNLAERRRNMGNQISGGEQQMLSIGRALMCNPRILLLDEPLEGLAPVLIEQLLAALQTLKTEYDLTILMVEQQAEIALELAPRAIILDRGRIVYSGPSHPLLADERLRASYLGVRAEPAPDDPPVQAN